MRDLLDALRRRTIWTVLFTLMIAIAVTPVLAKRPGGGGVSHTAIQTPPIQLGTSGGWRFDLANGFCCGGTLGALVTDGTDQYILSNFHVFAADVDCTDNICSEIDELIIQPGLIDVACNADSGQNVATLSAWADPLDGTNIDAAIALVSPGMVRTDGSILEIGRLSAATLAPALNLAVKKSGRTSRLTRSKITGLNASILVSYDTECAGASRGTATFTNQIVVGNRGSKFLKAGDSGSLMVEDVDTPPRAIGLLYAGSSFTAIANPIGDVLGHFSKILGKPVAMVGEETGAQAAEIPVTAVEEAKKAQARHAERLKKVPGGVGHGIGLDRSGRVVIKVYVEKDTPEVRAAVPDSVDGIPVEIEVTGKIVPFSSCQPQS